MNIRYCEFKDINDNESHLLEYRGAEKVLYISNPFKVITVLKTDAFKDLEKTRVIVLDKNVKSIEPKAISSVKQLVVYSPLEEENVNFNMDSQCNVTFRFGMKYIVNDSNVFYATFKNGTATIFDNSLVDYFELNEGENERQVQLKSTVSGCVVTIIEDYALANAYNVERIVLPENLQSIGKHSFSLCSSLQYVWLPPHVEYIGDNSFEFCKSLKYIVMSKLVKTIGDHVLHGFTSGSFLLEGNIKNINHGRDWNSGNTYFNEFKMIHGIDGVEYALLNDGKATVIDGSKITKKEITIQSCFTINNKDYIVEEIGPSSFKGNHRVQKISLPNSIKYIHKEAFMDSFIEEINIPEDVKQLSDSLFRNCKYLSSVIMNNAVKEIGDYCFHFCESLEKIDFTERLEYVGINAFEFSGLRNLNYSVSLKMINPSLSGTKIHTLVIPDSVQELTNYSIGHIESLRSLVFLDEKINLDNYVIHYFENLTVTYPGTRNEEFESKITSGLDVKCNFQYGLDYIYYHKGILYGVFSVFNEVRVLGYDFWNVKTEVKIQEQVNNIPVKAINQYALQGANISKITIPDSVIAIGDCILKDCHYLSELTLRDKCINTDHWVSGNTNIAIKEN